MPLPVCMADHHGAATPRLSFFGSEKPAAHGLDLEHTEEFRRHHGGVDVLSARAGNRRTLTVGIVGHRIESGTLVVPVMEIRRGDGAVPTRLFPERGQLHDAIRLPVSERL